MHSIVSYAGDVGYSSVNLVCACGCKFKVQLALSGDQYLTNKTYMCPRFYDEIEAIAKGCTVDY